MRGMRVRFAGAEDVESVIDLGARMHALSRFECVGYERAKVRRVLHHAVGNPAYMLAVAEASDGVMAGFHLANMDRYFFSDS